MFLFAFLIMMGVSMNASAKKVHTLGDSTMANYDENVTNTRGWGMYFGNFLTNGWTSVNYAKGGRDSRAGYNELWQNAKNNVEAGDYVLTRSLAVWTTWSCRLTMSLLVTLLTLQR